MKIDQIKNNFKKVYEDISHSLILINNFRRNERI